MATHIWSELSSPALASLVAESDGCLVAVAVVGATEQHGPHLPLGTDTRIGQGLLACACAQLSQATSVVLMPDIVIGASEEHSHFVGTISLSPKAMAAHLSAYGEALARAGISRWVIVNAHGGNVGVIESVAISLRKRLGLVIAKAYYPKFHALPDGPDASEIKYGLHGGQLETSIVSALSPNSVAMDKAKHFEIAHPPFAGQAPVAWLAEDLNPEGVAGRASDASAQEGEALLKHYGTALAEVIRATATHPLPPKSSKV